MPIRIEVFPRADTIGYEPRGQVLQSRFADSFPVSAVRVVDVYTIDKPYGASELADIAAALTNPVTQRYSIRQDDAAAVNPAPNEDAPLADAFDWAAEIGFLPGVTDNVATTVREIIEDVTGQRFAGDEGVYSSRLLLLEGASLDQSQVMAMAYQLANPLINRVHIKDDGEYRESGGMPFIVPQVHLDESREATEVPLDIPEAALAEIGKKGISNGDGTFRGPLGLSLDYMLAIREYFAAEGRAPRDIELETLAQTWSEHCKHTIFASPIDDIKDGIYKHYIRRATNTIRERRGNNDICVSVFTDNAGAIIFDDEWLITDKVETHNSPSALDPFGGSITGIVGVNRDALGFGMGSKPVINRYGFCFADPRSTPDYYRGPNQSMPMLPPAYIMEGVVHGVNEGGNCSGIPTPQGFVWFDDRYAGKPLVFVGTVGLIPRYLPDNSLSLRERAGVRADNIRTIPPAPLVERGRELRKTLTDAEKLLWQCLRNRQLHGYKFRRQHPEGTYVADFACVESKLIIELDGGQHAEEKHTDKDRARTVFLEERGFEVVRFWNNDVLENTEGVLETILAKLQKDSPHPGPLPKGEGGKPSHIKKARPGDAIVMVGGRVGKDGIHGATFSSEALDEGSPATAVQIGDPITQKKFSDVIVREARDAGLYSAITDNGAGGLSSSVGEMAEGSGGFHITLDKVPLKYPGMSPWEIWISESQERMTLAVPPENVAALIALFARRGAEATVIGEFTDSGRAQASYDGQVIMDITMDFLHDGLPEKQLTTLPVIFAGQEPSLPEPQDLARSLTDMMERLNICSREFIAVQYDHEVQASSVLKPLQGKGRVYADATVSRPVLDSPKGAVTSQGLAPRYSDIDCYHMAAASIDIAVRTAVAAGCSIDYLALCDNFCWCDSTNPERLYQLKRAAEACYDIATQYGTPFISGKDSMFNDFRGYNAKGEPIHVAIPPTLLISALGVVEDVTQSVSLDAKIAGDLIYVIGETRNELGGSEYYDMHGEVGANVPQLDAVQTEQRYRAYHKAVEQELVASAIAVTHGGLGVALAKMLIAGQLGAEIALSNISTGQDAEEGMMRDDTLLFSESLGRLLVTIAPSDQRRFDELMAPFGAVCIGEVMAKPVLRFSTLMGEPVTVSLDDLADSYREPLRNY